MFGVDWGGLLSKLGGMGQGAEGIGAMIPGMGAGGVTEGAKALPPMPAVAPNQYSVFPEGLPKYEVDPKLMTLPNAGGGGKAPFDWVRAAQMLGQTGSALSPEGSWQHELGKVGSSLATSDIYGKAAGKTSKNRSSIDEAIKGLGGITSKGTPGVTGFERGKDGDYTIKGDLDVLGTSSRGGTTSSPENDIYKGLQNPSNFL